MAAFISIVGFPAGATAFIDGVNIGITPIGNFMLKIGKYRIVVEKEGYVPEVREEFVVFNTDRKKTMVYNLSRIGASEFGGE